MRFAALALAAALLIPALPCRARGRQAQLRKALEAFSARNNKQFQQRLAKKREQLRFVKANCPDDPKKAPPPNLVKALVGRNDIRCKPIDSSLGGASEDLSEYQALDFFLTRDQAGSYVRLPDVMHFFYAPGLPGEALDFAPYLIMRRKKPPEETGVCGAYKAWVGLVSPGGAYKVFKPDKIQLPVKAQYLGKPGKTSFTIHHPAKVKSPSYTLFANEVTMLCEPKPEQISQRALDRSVGPGPAVSFGMRYKVRVEVRGPTDLSRWSVKWSGRTGASSRGTLELLEGAGVEMGDDSVPELNPEVSPETGSFTKQGDLWTAQTEVYLPTKGFDKVCRTYGPTGLTIGSQNRDLSVSVDLAASGPEGGFAVGGECLMFAPPPFGGMKLKGKSGAGQPMSPADLFVTPDGSTSCDLLVTMDFGNGVYTMQDFPFDTLFWLKLQQDGTNLLSRTGRGRVAPSGNRTGKAALRAYISAQDARFAGLIPPPGAKRIESEPLTVTVNRLFMRRTRGPGGRVNHVLSIMGPADMNRYRAKWHYTDKTDATCRFVTDNGLPSAILADVPGRYLHKVELLDRAGAVVTTFSVLRWAPSGCSPEVAIRPPSMVFQAAQTKLTADVRNLPRDLWSRTVCRWEMDPSYGYFVTPKQTKVQMTNEMAGISQAVVFLWERKYAQNELPDVKCKLILRETK